LNSFFGDSVNIYMWCCGSQNDISEAVAMVINHQEEAFMKRMIVRILQNYANTTTNTIDNALVDEVEKRLFSRHSEESLGVMIHFPL